MVKFLKKFIFIKTFLQLRKILKAKERKSLFILIIFVFIGMIFEIAGLGILIPLISIIIKSDFLIKNQEYIQFLGLSSLNRIELMVLILGSIVFFYLMKLIFILYLSYRQNRFLSNLNASISKRLFKSYLNQHYSFFLKRKPSNLIKLIQVETSYFNSVCTGIVSLTVESLLFISVLFTMIIVDPFATIITSISIIFFSYILSFALKNKLTSLGVLRSTLDEKLNMQVIQSFEGIRDIKIFGIEGLSSLIYEKNIMDKAKVLSLHNTYSQFPRFFLEFIAVVGLVGFILTQLLLGNSTNEILTTLGIFIAATFRLIPSINKILVSLQNIRFYNPSINSILQEFDSFIYPNTLKEKSEDFFKIVSNISINSLSFRYAIDEPWIFKDLNLNVNRGEAIGIIGKSGIGKSTLVDLISGLISPTHGNIMFNGQIISEKLEFWKQSLGYVSQDIFLLEGTIAENIAIGIPTDKIDKIKISEVIKIAKIDDYINSLCLGIQTLIKHNGKEFSGGQIKRIALARALYRNPDLIILDETTSALDSETENAILHTILSLKRDKFIFIITHNDNSFSLFDKLYEISNKNLKQIII